MSNFRGDSSHPRGGNQPRVSTLANIGGRALFSLMSQRVHVIAACAANGVIGQSGRLPWRLPEDYTRFEAMTAGHTCIMGRISFLGWSRATHDGRQPIVISRDTKLARPGVVVQPSLSAALLAAEQRAGEVYICGGESIYREALALDRPIRLHLTLIDRAYEGNTRFPEWRHLAWREVAREIGQTTEPRLTFLTLDRAH
jgi:dihydrofolate reductase